MTIEKSTTNLGLVLQQLVKKVNTAGTDENLFRLVPVLRHGARVLLELVPVPGQISARHQQQAMFRWCPGTKSERGLSVENKHHTRQTANNLIRPVSNVMLLPCQTKGPLNRDFTVVFFPNSIFIAALNVVLNFNLLFQNALINMQVSNFHKSIIGHFHSRRRKIVWTDKSSNNLSVHMISSSSSVKMAIVMNSISENVFEGVQ